MRKREMHYKALEDAEISHYNDETDSFFCTGLEADFILIIKEALRLRKIVEQKKKDEENIKR